MDEIFTYGNGTMLGALFQAVAALTATNDYLQLIRIIFIVATAVAALEIAWTGRFTPTGRLFGIILILNAAILTKVDIQITDRVNPANSSAVANVPAGLAVPLAYATALGDWATQAFETIFSLPTELRFRTNGMLFAGRLMEASTQFTVTDPTMAKNLAEFSEGCIYYGALAGWFDMETLVAAGDVWAALPPAAFGNAIFVSYTDPATGSTVMEGCRDARVDIGNDWANAIDKDASVFGQRLFPQYSEADAKARLLSVLPQSWQFMSSISESAADIIRQNAMINTLRRSYLRLANNTGATAAAQDFALAMAEAQQRTTYATLGALAGRMMSLFRNVLETLIYGIFPLAIIFIMVSLYQGKAVFTYLKLLFWLQLWPPMYAILHYAMLTYGSDVSTAAAMQAGGGSAVLNMLTYSGIRAVNGDMSAMAGYLSWMIPMFSWAMVSGSGFAASQLAASLGQVAQSSGSAAAAAAATGNIDLGNYSVYNSTMWQKNNAPSIRSGMGSMNDPVTGMITTTTAGGMQFQAAQSTSMPFSMNLSNAIKSSVATSASHARQALSSATSAFTAATGATYSSMSRLSQMAGATTSVSNGVDSGTSAQYKSDLSKLNKILDGFDFGKNLSREQKAQVLAAASAGLKVAGSGASSGINIAGASVSSEDWKKAMQYARDSKFSKVWTNTRQSGEQLSAQLAKSSGDSQTREIAAGFSEQRNASRGLQSALTEAQSWQRLSQRLNESGASGGQEMTAALLRYGNARLAGSGVTMQDLAAQSASTTGDPAAANARLQGIINDFVASGEVARIAGISATPNSSGADTAHRSNEAGVQAAAGDTGFQAPGSGAVKTTGTGWQSGVEAEAAARGVPAAGEVQNEASALRGKVKGALDQNRQVVADGTQAVQVRGDAIESSSRHATDREQPHLPAAFNEISEQIAASGPPSVGAVMQLATGRIPEFNDYGARKPPDAGEVGVVQGDGPRGDLPPIEWETNPPTTPSRNGKTWANRLD